MTIHLPEPRDRWGALDDDTAQIPRLAAVPEPRPAEPAERKQEALDAAAVRARVYREATEINRAHRLQDARNKAREAHERAVARAHQLTEATLRIATSRPIPQAALAATMAMLEVDLASRLRSAHESYEDTLAAIERGAALDGVA